MKLYTTSGIVLKSIKYSETSLILDILTREKGLRSFIVSGARTKGPKARHGLYQVMNQIQLVAYDNMEEKLNRIKEAKVFQHYKTIPYKILKSSVALFMIELVRNSIKEKEANEELYDFIVGSFMALDSEGTLLTLFPHKFMLDLSAHLGFYPLFDFNSSSPYFNVLEGRFTSDRADPNTLNVRESEIMKLFLTSSESLAFNTSDRSILLDILIRLYRHHIENFKELKTLEVLHTVLH
jgi:DNA repair protein RecO (recombination protein O)